MKRIALVTLFFIISASALTARDLNNNILISLYGGGGMAWPGGDFNRDYETEAAVDWSLAGGLSVAWAPFSHGAVSLGAEYAYRRLSVNMTDLAGNDITETMTVQFIDVMLGWKGFVAMLYYEAGFYAGVPFGTWENNAKREGSDATPVLGPDGAVDSGDRQIEYGAYFGVGLIYWVGKNIALEGGLRLQVSYADAYKNEDDTDDNTLKTRALMVKLGVTCCL